MNRASFHDGGAFCRSDRVLGNQTATAGSTGDATEVDGAWLNRLSSAYGMATSAKLIINYTTTLNSNTGATLSFSVQFQDADDSSGTNAADYASAVAATAVATGNSGGSVETGTVEVDIDLDAAKQYVRAQITPDLSAAGVDTAAWSSVIVWFGFHEGPVTKAVRSVRAYEAT